MSNVLIVWELGSGLGHAVPLRAVGVEFVRRGHRVSIAAPNVELCRQAFASTGVETIAAPSLPLSEKRLKFPCTYSDILHDCGYSSAENLTTAVRHWLNLVDQARPDLVIADHSPTAVLASRLRTFSIITVGTGFVCPPDVSPLPSLRKEIPEPHWAAEVEQIVLDNMNAALKAHGGKAIDRVTQIYADSSRQYLLTFKELDHYAAWRGQKKDPPKYWTPIGAIPGQLIDWPHVAKTTSATPRIFIYLRGEPNLAAILRGLAYKQIPTICFAPHEPAEEHATLYGTSVLVTSSPVDLAPIAHQCSVAVLNGGHGTVCEFLRAGAPMLILPQTLEQRITANRLTERGVGLQVSLGDLNGIGSALEQLLQDPVYKTAAKLLSTELCDVPEEFASTYLVGDMEKHFLS